MNVVQHYFRITLKSIKWKTKTKFCFTCCSCTWC